MPFITFEGIEGSGKSTQLKLLAESLRAERPFRLEREPGGTPLGAALRAILLDPGQTSLDAITELLLLEADRRQHVGEVLAPAIARGELVLCDRFNDATFAYQVGGRGLPADLVGAVDAWVTGGLRPDRTILLDCPVEVGLERARERDLGQSARFEREPAAFHERVRDAYLDRARREPERFRVFDSRRNRAELHEDIRRDVLDLVGR